MMRKFCILFLATSCLLTSCNVLTQKMTDEQIAEIKDAQNKALEAIDQASSTAVSMAETAISEATTQAIANASEDLNNTIKEAEKSIAASVGDEINKTISAEKAQTESKINGLRKLVYALFALSIVALLAAIGAIVLLFHRTSHESIVQEVLGAHRVKDMISAAVTDEVNLKTQSTARYSDLSNEVKRQITSPAMIQYLAKTLKIGSNNAAAKESLEDGQENHATPQGVKQAPAAEYEPKVELYARDSREMELRGVTYTYQPGKSIFKLTLSSATATLADIAICTEKPEVLQRIIQSDQDLIEPVCKIASKVNRPTDVKWTAGKAEKVGSDSWLVREQIIVELV